MEHETKRASWLELFFDLAFVALVAQLTYVAASHHTYLSDFLHIGIVGYSIFFTWWTATVQRNLQEKETVFDQLAVQLMVVGAFVMSVTMNDVFKGEYAGYFVTLGVLRLVQVGLLYRLYQRSPAHRPQTYNVANGITVAGVLWIVSALMPDPYHYVVAVMALLIDILSPRTVGKGNKIRLLNVHHMQERLGLFFLLVLGESMLVVALANPVASATAVSAWVVLSGLGLILMVWWLYFDFSERCAAGVRPRSLFWYLQSHVVLFISMIIIAAGYKHLIAEQSLDAETLLLIAAGLGGMVTALLGTRLALFPLPSAMRTVFAGTAGLLFLVSVFHDSLSPLGFLLCTLIIMLGFTTIDRMWFRRSVQ